MRKLSFMFGTVMGVCVGTAPFAATAGDTITPFGIEQGISIEQLSTKQRQRHRFVVQLKHAPEPHPSFSQIGVLHTEETGVCGVVGHGKLYSTNDKQDMLEFKDHKSDLKEVLKEKYGEPNQKSSNLSAVSIAGVTAAVTTGIDPDIKPPLWWEPKSKNVVAITFKSVLIKTRVLSYAIRYTFSNRTKCRKIIDKKRNNNL